MAEFETVSVPFIILGNRQYLTDLQAHQEPWIIDFINTFPNCFERLWNFDGWVFWPEGDAPQVKHG